ncbi:uncharacterized protein AAES06_018023 [Glossophaga mutica]
MQSPGRWAPAEQNIGSLAGSFTHHGDRGHHGGGSGCWHTARGCSSQDVPVARSQPRNKNPNITHLLDTFVLECLCRAAALGQTSELWSGQGAVKPSSGTSTGLLVR